jgi:hypothetical protein
LHFTFTHAALLEQNTAEPTADQAERKTEKLQYNEGYELNQRIFALGRLFSLLAADARAHARRCSGWAAQVSPTLKPCRYLTAYTPSWTDGHHATCIWLMYIL